MSTSFKTMTSPTEYSGLSPPQAFVTAGKIVFRDACMQMAAEDWGYR